MELINPYVQKQTVKIQGQLIAARQCVLYLENDMAWKIDTWLIRGLFIASVSREIQGDPKE